MRDGAAKSDRRARVLKDEDEPTYSPSCFETHRSAPKLWMQPCSRSRCDAPQHEGGAGLKGEH
jgi:hypothetical protein